MTRLAVEYLERLHTASPIIFVLGLELLGERRGDHWESPLRYAQREAQVRLKLSVCIVLYKLALHGLDKISPLSWTISGSTD